MADHQSIGTGQSVSSVADVASPSVKVAQSWTGGAVAFGLDRPLPLKGGEVLPPGRMPLELDLDWAPSVQAKAVEACLKQTAAGRDWFTMPPSIIVGRPGVGRTLIARTIARRAGVPFTTIDVSGASGAASLRPAPRRHDITYPSTIVMAIAAAGCANPVVLITGVEEAQPVTLDLVQSLVDPASNARWTEPALGAVIDLSYVTWLVQSSAPLGIARKLSHLPQLAVELDREHEALRVLTILSEVFDDLRIDPRTLEYEASFVIDELVRDRSKGAGVLREQAERLVTRMVREQS